ncbi:hypothetical protein AB0N19_28215, partial [Streptomyces sp. NPDC051132]
LVGAGPVDPVQLGGRARVLLHEQLRAVRRPAGAVLDFLAGAPWPDPGVPVTVAAPLRWIAPNRVQAAARPDRHVLRTGTPLPRPVLYVRQDGRLLHRERLGPVTALPGRTLTLGTRWHGRVDPGGGEIRVATE